MIILNSSPPSLINTVFFYVLNPYLFLSNYVIIVGIEKKKSMLWYLCELKLSILFKINGSIEEHL